MSGSGRSLENLAAAIDRGEVPAEIAIVVSSRLEAYGIERARQRGLEALVLRPKDVPGRRAYSRAVFDELRAQRVDLVCLMGFLTLLEIPEDFVGRVLNIHPALLPEFGGQGMYGLRVHEAVLRSQASESGCTVHVCDNEYDHGPIVLQRRCPVLPGDTPETLAARVFEEEKRAYPEAIRRVLRERRPSG